MWFSFFITWEQRKLLDCLDKITDFRGRTPKKLGMDWSESGYLALSALNVKDGYIDFTQDVHYGSQELYDKWMTGNELHKGQVLFTTEAPMGNVAQVPDNRLYILSQRIIAFDVKPNLITEDFLATVLRSPAVFATLTALSSGGTAKGVSQKSLSTVYIMTPTDLEEQKQLASFFLDLDNLITLHQRKGKSRFYQILLKKLLSKMTIYWEQRKLGDLGEFASNGVDKLRKPNEVSVNLLNYMDVYNRRPISALTCCELMQVTAKPIQVKNNNIEAGDVYFTPTSETAEDIGHVLVIEENLPNTVYSYHLMRYRPHKGIFYKTYPNYGFDTNNLHKQMAVKAKGVQRFVISKPDFEGLEVTFPAYTEQEKIATLLTDLDNLITLHQRGKNI